jgi:hypothetical protein
MEEVKNLLACAHCMLAQQARDMLRLLLAPPIEEEDE